MRRIKLSIPIITIVLAFALEAVPSGWSQQWATSTAPTSVAVPRRVPLIHAVGPVNMTVSNLDTSVQFYTRVLGFRKTCEELLAGENGTAPAARTANLQLGDETIKLTQYSRAGKPIPADSRSNDLWFQHIAIVVSDMEQAYAVLQAKGVVRISAAPQRLPDWNRKAAGIKAFYFQDPDGHPLEILHFPAGKGNPKWDRATKNIFLGIDHTAITVSDTKKSLAFYRDLLGMQVVGESENYGPEQERLNNVGGAHLRITSLHADSGPGIELLDT